MKSVRVEAGSAITILNAIYADFGAAIGIDVPINVEITENESLEINTIPHNPLNLIDSCIELIAEETDIQPDQIKISTYSPVPSERGLKTSSAISCALISALSEYYSLNYEVDEIIRKATTASIRAGVTITGAYDDSYASFTGGLVITDNKTGVPVHHVNLRISDQICLIIPDTSTPKESIDISRYYMADNIQKQILKRIMNEELYDVIRLNTEFYAPKLLPNPDIISYISDLPCQVVGLNGAGPSLFAFCTNNEVNSFIHSVKESFPNYHVMKTSLKPIYRQFV
ncbi:MAG: shikimate kinase [Candidatus Heimdallarchaeota archaeon]|nr:shikimate kinase [Candidatus Heimdallarchaeota archaeon]